MTVPRRRGLTLAAALAVVAIVSQGLVSPTRGAETPVAPLVAPGAWTATSTLSTARIFSTVTTLDGPACRGPNATPPAWCGKVLAAGGQRGSTGVLGSAELYDPTTGYWSPTGAMLAPRHNHTATLLANGKVLVAGGVGGANGVTPLDSAELYDPATGRWAATGPMVGLGGVGNGARYRHTATALDGPRCRGIATLPVLAPWCGKVLVVGGIDTVPDGSSPLTAFAPLPTLRTAALYDPATGAWAATGSLAAGRYDHTMTTIDSGPCRTPAAPLYCGKVLVAGGASTAAPVSVGLTAAELYDPDLGQWAPTGAMETPRYRHAAVLLDGPTCRTSSPACNKVLVASGFRSATTINADPEPLAELYDPVAGTWSPTKSPMSRGRAEHHTLTVLDGPACRSATPAPHCGKVVVTGGTVVSGRPSDLFDPSSSEFRLTGAQITGAAGHAVLLDGPACQSPSPPLHCGRILVFGKGATSGGAYAELFDGSAAVQPPSAVDIDPVSGPGYGGIAVALTGAGFTNATEVRFGDTEAPHFTVESPTRIVATSPTLAPGEVDVTVRGPAGTSAAINLTRFTAFRPTHEWATTGSTVTPRLRSTLTALADGRVLVAGGEVSGFKGIDSSEVFDPVSGRWDPVGSLSTARRGHTATRLANGEVLVVGGIGSACCAVLSSAEVFDPTPGAGAGAWRTTGSLNEARAFHTATLLPSGKVLVAGGIGGPARASAELYDPALGVWTTIAPLSTARSEHHAALLQNGSILVTGGVVGTNVLKSSELYNPSTNNWTSTGSLARPRRNHTVTALPDGRVLVAGGCVDGLCGQPESAEIYVPSTGVWTTTAGMRGARYYHSAALLEGSTCGELCGKVLMAGGTGADGPQTSAELFDPATGNWIPALPLTSARTKHHAALLPGGRVLAVGGEGAETSRVLNSAEILGVVAAQRPPVVSAVQPLAGGPGTRVRISGTGLSGTTTVTFGDIQVVPVAVTEYLVVALSPPQARGTVKVTVTTPLGTSVNRPLSADDDFSYASGRWLAGPSLSTARYLHTSTLLDGAACHSPAPPAYCGKVLVAGGTDNFVGATTVPHDSAELYDPSAGDWSPIADMAATRFNHTATLLDGPECRESAPPSHCGKVLVAGGEVGVSAIAGTELYDPVSGMWTSAGSLAEARFSHTATLLGDGRVLVVGGSNNEVGRPGLASAEIYDPVSGTWTTTASPASARGSHTATLLSNGQVLVAGGLTGVAPGDTRSLANAEIYDPVANTWTPVNPMAATRFAHTATLLSGPRCGVTCGKVLVVGGVNTLGGEGTTFHASAELFDPISRTWSPILIPGTARAGHTATLLPNGTVLVAGSALPLPADPRPAPLASSELYDPATGRWSFTPFLAAPRGLHGTDVLNGPACRQPGPPAYCGTALASGGATVGSSPADDLAPAALGFSELYAPAPDVSALSPSTGSNDGGTPVVVTGTRFAGATAVRFGAVPAASFTVDSPTRITAVSPQARSGEPVEVIVEGAGGSSAVMGGNRAALFTYVGLPGAISTLVARAVSATAIELSFAAAHNGDGSTPAQDYVVKQSPEEITEANFDTAGPTALCGGKCHFDIPALAYTLRVDDLEPGQTYHYALRAVNEKGRGPLSADASVIPAVVATAPAPACPALPVAGAGSVVYPGGRYSLIGLPGDTVVGSDSPLYGWSDLGAGGAYSVLDASHPVTAGKGYWAWFACPRAVNMNLPAAGGAASASFALGAYHASMVGNPSATSRATVTGHDFAARWDPGAANGSGGYVLSGYRERQSLAVGEGTWTFAYENTTIAVAVQLQQPNAF